VDRAALLRETRLRLPGLSPWAEWCYGHHSRLLTLVSWRSFVIRSWGATRRSAGPLHSWLAT
jgi:hypothetical protein